MKTMLNKFYNASAGKRLFLSLALILTIMVVSVSMADVFERLAPRGTVPNPGTQQQELANITAPAPYNVYEFVGTCAACHGGTIDQMAGHFGNWAGTSMASAARDPIFRANQIGVEMTVEAVTGQSGAGNMCFRCHSPNGWMSGRFDPDLAGGDPRGSTMIHSILLSTDDEGILCEACHRAMGNVEFQRGDLDAGDPVWNMLAGTRDWPHLGKAYVDQAGDPTIAQGNPYGDTTLQMNDGMLYVGKYSGSVDLYFSDIPTAGSYTGQTYGVWPDSSVAFGPDGSVPLHFEYPIGVPSQGNNEIFQAQAISLEHPTAGGRPRPLRPQPVPPGNTFIRTPEFCGSCHELVVPILNHGMPEQRTYSEWKFSDFGRAYERNPASGTRCQDCHMPTMMHEYADDARVSVNPDPTVSGWFPYAKDRNPDGGTAFHKFAGANRDLPEMMKVLYPEPDLELLGARTGNDPRVFPGMLSTRDPMYDRARRNTEISLADAVDVQISQAPTWVLDAANPNGGYWEVKVRVTNNSGHRIPTGYPDGRRFWIELQVSDGSGAPVYRSGYYDPDAAELMTEETIPFNRALEPLIDAANGANAVMVYERITGTCSDANGAGIFPDPEAGVPASCTASPSLLNNFILFDNRILPAGFDYAALRASGVKFWNYDAGSGVPYEDTDRYPEGQNWDEVTYRFDAAPDTNLVARAEVYWQTHTREFMDHLRVQDTSTVRPEGPINAFMPGYPNTANYLSEEIGLASVAAQHNETLNDNWGGIAYAAWLLTGKGAPYLVAAADTDNTATAVPPDPVVSASRLVNPFDAVITWSAVPGADAYLVWIRYGVAEATAAWDKLAIVKGTSLELNALNVGKTYGFRVQALNAAGASPGNNAVSFTTSTDVPLAPENLRVVSAAPGSVALTWFDIADNETGFIIERQTVAAVPGDFVEIARIPSQGNGSVQWTDMDPALTADNCYVYRVAAYNPEGVSTWTAPVTACVGLAPNGAIVLTLDPAGPPYLLSWSSTATNTVLGFRIERIDQTTNTTTIIQIPDPLAISYLDAAANPGTRYCYTVFAYNFVGSSAPSNVVCTTANAPPAAPTNLTAVLTLPSVTLTWTDNANDEEYFVIERSDNNGAFAVISTQATANLSTYVDETIATGVNTYVYRVAAGSQAGGLSSYSNLATVVTGEIPQAPSGLTIIRERKDAIQMSWLDNAANEEGYYVERSPDGVVFSRIDQLPPNSTTFTDTAVTRRTTYWYRVQAFNPSGLSAYSETVSGTTR